MPENLFFLAVIPPEPIYGAIRELKEQFAKNYDSRHALKSPPHVTLIPPFWFDTEKIEEVIKSVSDLISIQESFKIELRNFDCFKPRVIFVDVLDSTDKLRNLHADLKEDFKTNFDLTPDKRATYRPHCTIGFKDLSPKMFYQAWDYFKGQLFHEKFTVAAISLLQYEEGRWKVKKETPLK